jgi:hypothetical protein
MHSELEVAYQKLPGVVDEDVDDDSNENVGAATLSPTSADSNNVLPGGAIRLGDEVCRALLLSRATMFRLLIILFA